MRKNYKASRYGLAQAHGFRTLHEIQKAKKKGKVRPSDTEYQECLRLLREARKNKP